MSIKDLKDYNVIVDGIVNINELGMYVSASAERSLVSDKDCEKLDGLAQEFSKALDSLSPEDGDEIFQDVGALVEFKLASKVQRLKQTYQQTIQSIENFKIQKSDTKR